MVMYGAANVDGDQCPEPLMCASIATRIGTSHSAAEYTAALAHISLGESSASRSLNGIGASLTIGSSPDMKTLSTVRARHVKDLTLAWR